MKDKALGLKGLDDLLDQIKNTADRFTLYYPNLKDPAMAGIMKNLENMDLSRPNVFVIDDNWRDYGNGLKGKIIRDLSENRYVVTAWKCYQTVTGPTHLHLEDKTLYIISGRVEDPDKDIILADGRGYITVPAGQEHRLKIYSGTVFVTTYHESELSDEIARKLMG